MIPRKDSSLWLWLSAVFVLALHFEVAAVTLDDAAVDADFVCSARGELRVGSETEDGDDKDDEAAAIMRASRPKSVRVLGPGRIVVAGIGPRAGYHATPERPPDIG